MSWTMWFRLLLLLIAACCFSLAVCTYGTNDMLFFKSYEAAQTSIGVKELYARGAQLVEWHSDLREQMAHPPAVLHFLTVVKQISTISGCSFQTVFRIITSLAYILGIIAVAKLLNTREATIYALCPAGIFVAGFHGNTDPIVVALLLWAIYFQQDARSLVSGLLLAAACSTKVWPIIVIPAFLLSFNGWKEVARFSLGFAATAGLLAYPYLYDNFHLISGSVLGWRSYPGLWGLTIFFPAYKSFGLPLVALCVLAVTIAGVRNNLQLMQTVALVISLFVLLTPGFGVQYLHWILPFCSILSLPAQLAFYIFSSVFTFLLYSQWNGGYILYFSDSLRSGLSYSTLVLYFSFVAWIILAVSLGRTILNLFFKTTRKQTKPLPD